MDKNLIVEPVSENMAMRCAEFARAQQLGPAGTAGSYGGYVVVEVPLPWPREITDHPALADAASALADAGIRVQAVVPSVQSHDERRHVVCFTRPRGGFDRYVANPFETSDESLSNMLIRLAGRVVAGEPLDGLVAPGRDRAAEHTSPAAAVATALRSAARGARPGEVEGAPRITPDDRHVLICTHGRRDACCGTSGTRLSVALPGLGAGVHVWRTSHTGGHRFAPTALLLPEGTVWGYVDIDSLTGISDRTLAPEAAADLYRGCTGLDAPEVQAVDGEALRTIGWSWLDHRRTGRVVERDGTRAHVVLDGEAPDGRRRQRLTATVEVTRMMPVPDCGNPPGEAKKSAPELRVDDLRVA